MKRLGIFLVFLVIPALVSAHVYIRSVEPQEDAALAEAPKTVKMMFIGSLEPAFSKIEVFDAEGGKISKKPAFSEYNSIMEVELDEELGSGTYTVKWKCMSKDGHSQKGSFSFSVK
jgi:methionine-rich copper-binding protein CopC